MTETYTVTLQEMPFETDLPSSNCNVEVGSPWFGKVNGLDRAGEVSEVDHSKGTFTVVLSVPKQ
jgi:hypothetical protein